MKEILQRVVGMRRKLERIVARGAQPPGPPVAERALRDFENVHEIEIPEDIRIFATTVGLGGAGPGRGLNPMDSWTEALMEPAPGILAMPSPLDPLRGFGDYTDAEDPAQGALCLANFGACAPFTLVIVAGAHRGQIVRYEMESEWCEWVDLAWPLGPAGFLDWYEGWLDLAIQGVVAPFFGAGLIGAESQLRQAILKSSSQYVALRAIRTLAILPKLETATLDALESAFESGTPEIRAAVLPCLAKLGREFDRCLLPALEDPSPSVRYAALAELARQGASMLSRVAEFVDDIDDRVAGRASILVDGTPYLDVDKLGRLYARPSLRLSAVSALRNFPTSDALGLLVQGLEDSSPDVRRVSAYSLGSIGLAEGIPALIPVAMRDPEPLVRKAAMTALASLGGSIP